MKISKKGEFGETLQNIFAVLVLFLIIMAILAIVKEADVTVEYDLQGRDVIDRDILFINFLKTKVNEKTFLDLFVEAYYNEDFTAVNSKTIDFFENVKGNRCPVAGMKVFKEGEIINSFVMSSFLTEEVPLEEISSIDIPLKKPGEFITLKMEVLC